VLLYEVISSLTNYSLVSKYKQKLFNKSECIWSKFLTKYIKFIWLIFTNIFTIDDIIIEGSLLVIVNVVESKQVSDSIDLLFIISLK
jgi:hypothetical protein